MKRSVQEFLLLAARLQWKSKGPAKGFRWALSPGPSKHINTWSLPPWIHHWMEYWRPSKQPSYSSLHAQSFRVSSADTPAVCFESSMLAAKSCLVLSHPSFIWTSRIPCIDSSFERCWIRFCVGLIYSSRAPRRAWWLICAALRSYVAALFVLCIGTSPRTDGVDRAPNAG